LFVFLKKNQPAKQKTVYSGYIVLCNS